MVRKTVVAGATLIGIACVLRIQAVRRL